MRVLVLQRKSNASPPVSWSLSVDARIAEIMDFLRMEGLIEYAVSSVDNPATQHAIKWADMLVFSKIFSEAEAELSRLAQKMGKAVILDIDDNIFSPPKYSAWIPNDSASLKKKIGNIQKLVDYIVVENSNILDKISPYHARCAIAANGMNVRKYTKKTHPKSLQKQSQYLFTRGDNLALASFRKDFIEMLCDFHADHKDTSMAFYGDLVIDIVKLPFVQWIPRIRYSDYMELILKNGYIFGIVPLGGEEDTDELCFNELKSPIKYMNYGLARVPSIYSDSLIYNNCVQHGKTGLLVKNDYNTWFKAMSDMASNATLREQISDNAYHDVVTNYSIKNAAMTYHTILTSLGKR
jgi:hypothetical protein